MNGKPLIAYTIEEALKSKYINRVIVSTDDINIADVSGKFGAEIPFLRPTELSSDYSPTIDAVIYTIQRLQDTENYFPDYICLLQCTTPMKTAEHIDGAIEKLLRSDTDGIVSVCEVVEHPYWMQVFKGDKLEYFIRQEKKMLRRQELPPIYRFNGAIWVVKTAKLLQERKMVLDNETGYVMSIEDSIDIDTEDDFKLAEKCMKKRLDTTD
jgi:N-acylneuraminate cytidylyltransferase/CMP-N,N'-diacetyllegionaminic acid synthase